MQALKILLAALCVGVARAGFVNVGKAWKGVKEKVARKVPKIKCHERSAKAIRTFHFQPKGTTFHPKDVRNVGSGILSSTKPGSTPCPGEENSKRCASYVSIVQIKQILNQGAADKFFKKPVNNGMMVIDRERIWYGCWDVEGHGVGGFKEMDEMSAWDINKWAPTSVRRNCTTKVTLDSDYECTKCVVADVEIPEKPTPKSDASTTDTIEFQCASERTNSVNTMRSECECIGSVRYGTHAGGGKWSDWQALSGSKKCSIKEFKGVDPAPGEEKYCMCRQAKNAPMAKVDYTDYACTCASDNCNDKMVDRILSQKEFSNGGGIVLTA